MRWQNIVTVILLVALTSFFLVGCYTVLIHPRLEVADEAGDISPVYVEHVDDCSQCHQGYWGYSMPAGLGAAAALESWRFYYEYPWWVDTYPYGTILAGSSKDMPEARDMGRRHSAQPGDHYTPTATASSPAPTPVLTKSAVSGGGNSAGQDVSSQSDSRRSVGRRIHDTSNSKKRSSSSRRK